MAAFRLSVGFIAVVVSCFISVVLNVVALDSQSENVCLAFHITVEPAHVKNLQRLIDRIYHPQNVYLIDYHPSIPKSNFLRLSSYRVNVYQQRADVASNEGVTEVLNVLDAIAFFLNREAFEHAAAFDYFIPLSSASYPLIPPKQLRQLLDPAIMGPHLLPPNFFHFTHPSQLPLFAEEVDTWHVDLALAFNASVAASIYTSHLPHPDRRRRIFSLPRAATHFVASRAFASFAVDSIEAKRLLLIVAETSHVKHRFFAALATAANQSLVGPIIRSASLHCVNSNAIDTQVRKSLPDYIPHIPSIAFLTNTSRPCLFAYPFDSSSSLPVRDAIDRQFLILPGTQGKPRGIAYYETTREKLKSLLS